MCSIACLQTEGGLLFLIASTNRMYIHDEGYTPQVLFLQATKSVRFSSADISNGYPELNLCFML